MATANNQPYFPFGFRYPVGAAYSDSNPDPEIEAVKNRVRYLNELHSKTTIPGHLFAAALDLFQRESDLLPDAFWSYVQIEFTADEVIAIVEALLPLVANEPERLEFPNAVALFDCRFVSTSEWEHIRRYSIGGSEASTVLGKSHFQSQRTLYHEKKTQFVDDKPLGMQHILDYGHAVESYVVSTVADRLGAVVYPEYRMFAHRDYCFITCNPDGILLFPDGTLALFEAKTAMWLKITDWKDGIPDYYAPQPQQYLEVLNDPRLTGGYIGVCLGGLEKDLIIHSYQRDPQMGAQQIQQVVDYWTNHIVPGILPAFSGNSKLDLTAQYKYLPPKLTATQSEKLPNDSIPEFELYYDLQAQRKVLESEANKAEAQASQLLEEIKLAVPEGLTICAIPGEMAYHITVKDTKKETVELSKLRAKDPNAYAQLEHIADKSKDVDLQWSIPKISKSKLTAKKKTA